ncbi:MAG: cobaltochelatase subunit CobN, partial [Pseudomonadota bacterium]
MRVDPPAISDHGGASGGAAPAPIRVVIITLDRHFSASLDRVRRTLEPEAPGLQVDLFAAADWSESPEALGAAKAAIAEADIVLTAMLFLDDHIRAILPDLEARRERCDAMVSIMSAQEVIKLTRAGRLDMSKPDRGPLKLLKKLRGRRGGDSKAGSSGAGQMAILKRIPKILRFIPGTAQDLRSYFLAMQYWLSGSDENLGNLIRLLVDRYAAGPRSGWRGRLTVKPPVEYPETGLYHPRLAERVTEDVAALPLPDTAPSAEIPGSLAKRPTVGIVLLRAYVLSRDAGHYDGVIAALEATGIRVIPAFAAGLDARPAIERFFMEDGEPIVDAVLSLTGFSLVGGPAYNDARAAEDMLARLDVPYLAAHALEFQSIEQWGASPRGLQPVENTIMVAIPELDGATNPIVYGGRSDGTGLPSQICSCGCGALVHGACDDRVPGNRDMHACPERARRIARRVERLIRLRRKTAAERDIAIVLFNFPPNAGAAGSAAFLGVWESLYNTL